MQLSPDPSQERERCLTTTATATALPEPGEKGMARGAGGVDFSAEAAAGACLQVGY